MYDLSQSIAGEYLSQFTYPWEALKAVSYTHLDVYKRQPYIGGEEEKSEKEPLRIWGHVDDEKKQIVPATSPVITCQCIRVPAVSYTHLRH